MQSDAVSPSMSSGIPPSDVIVALRPAFPLQQRLFLCALLSIVTAFWPSLLSADVALGPKYNKRILMVKG